MVLDGDGDKTGAHLPMIHIAFSNLKTRVLGRITESVSNIYRRYSGEWTHPTA